jgi:hypothetical protein
MWRKCGLLGTSLVLIGTAAFAWHRAKDVSVPDDPDEVTLLSIDGRRMRHPLDRGKPSDQELLYEYPVLGRVSITDPELRHRVVAAVKQDLDDRSDPDKVLCFFPRHVLHVVKRGRTINVLICFQCNRHQIYVDGRKITADEDPPVGKNSRELLNQILADAGIPLAP